MLADRRRSQRGSVLSGVLIITAFLAIISGALMTELSTNFLLSNALVNKVGTEATVNSAMELALNQLESTPIANGCPGAVPATPLPGPVTLNGRTAAVSYVSCWPTAREKPNFASIASAASFNVDGTHSVIQGTGQDLYVIGDSSGTIYSYQFGQSTPIWSRNMQGTITGPALAMQDAACQGNGPCPDTGGAGGSNADISYLVPIAGGGGSGCTTAACVELLAQDVPKPPDILCHMAATATVTSRPAAGVAFPQVAYFGDSGGTLYAYNATEFSCSNNGAAALLDSHTTPGNAAIVAGPIVFRNNNHDEVYVVTSNGTSTGSTSQLLDYAATSPGSLSSTPSQTLTLPDPSKPVGIAVENTGVPARVAITFADGGVAIALIDTTYVPRLVANAGLGTGIDDAPSWCSCPGGSQIGVTGDNGTLYVLDTNLNPVATYAGGSRIRTSPASDRVGEWFFGADDGYLHEVQQTPGQSTLVQVARYGQFGSVRSSVQVAGCPAGICIYLGSSNNAYLVSLDARDAKITACLSSTPPTCSGVNPRLWTQVEVGSAGAPQTVHVQGWSYYSP
jgi:hypothetical protein